MYGAATGCYVRVPFTVAGDPADYTFLTLKARYDDGFVAYLDGVELWRAGCSGTPTRNSTAASHEADAVEPFYTDQHAGVLRSGQNILAIHAMNVSTTSTDLLIHFSLEAGERSSVPGGGVSPAARRYTGPVTLDRSVRVKARARGGAAWSALNEAVFAVGPVAQSLRLSEIMYHPAATGNPDDPNTEFIELTNIGAGSINLNLVKLTDGVEFVFPDFDLAPGGYCLVVKDLAAFTARYGPGLPVAGRYAGSLSNSGERVELCDAADTVIHSFRFEDHWFDATDGGGFSLTLKDPRTADPAALGDKSLWQPSASAGGSPGTGG
jgi:hypothetical protein